MASTVPPFCEALLEVAAEHEAVAARLEEEAVQRLAEKHSRDPDHPRAADLLIEAHKRREVSKAARAAVANWM